MLGDWSIGALALMPGKIYKYAYGTVFTLENHFLSTTGSRSFGPCRECKPGEGYFSNPGLQV